MKRLSPIMILCSISISLLLLSCGTGKKLENANAQITQLNQQVDGLNKKIADQQSTINTLKSENVQYGKEAEDCRKVKEAVATRLENLNKALAERGTSLKQIREKAGMALKAFEDQGAEIEYKKGLLHISVPDKLAFPTGSTKLSDDGRQVISVVADVLIDNPGITVIIVGNTDSIAVKKGYNDNWSLSTERANAIVRVLQHTYKIDPSRLTAAGKGKYNPIGDNATPEGRSKNRRTDIIINPDLSRLWELSENN